MRVSWYLIGRVVQLFPFCFTSFFKRKSIQFSNPASWLVGRSAFKRKIDFFFEKLSKKDGNSLSNSVHSGSQLSRKLCYKFKFLLLFSMKPNCFHSNEKVGVDNEKALELTNSTVFHRGRQWKSSRAGQQNIFFSYFSLISI